MSVLRRPYELSIWGDTWDSTTNEFAEEKLVIIGSNTMTSQSRALQPKLVRNVNGTHTLTFSMYYQYKDNITGEDIENPYAPYLTNERKLKLQYDGQWYDFIIKSVKEDSQKHSYEISAIDQYINELSKNGFNLTFDAELNNNVGSVQTLAARALTATNWNVPAVEQQGSEFIPDRAKETLVQLTLTSTINVSQIDDDTPGVEPSVHSASIESGEKIYAFYSCLIDKTSRFQFIYLDDDSQYTKDDERIITNYNCQYYRDNTQYSGIAVLGMYIPSFCSTDEVIISNDYRGARYVFSPDTQYNAVIKQYVKTYTKDNVDYYGYSALDFKAPDLISNWVTNSDSFKSTAGWHTGTIANQAGSRGTIKNIAVRSDDPSITLLEDLKDGSFGEEHTYVPLLEYTNHNNGIIVNTGFYDSRSAIKQLINGQKFVCRIKGSAGWGNKNVSLQVGTVNNHVYSFDQTLASDTFSDSQDGWYTTILTIANCDFTEKQYKKQSNGRVYIVLTGYEGALIENFQIFEYVDNNGTYMAPDDQLVEAKTTTTYYLFDKEEVDTIDVGSTIADLKPVYAETVDPVLNGYALPLSCEKRRAITIKESNYFNVIQTLCETFECWADFIIDHDAEGAITSKKIVFKNYIGAQNWAGFRYGVNLKSVSRTDDSKAIVSKLIVKQNSNEFGTNGFCTIARAPSNETGETCIYNIDYYVNQGLLSMSDWNTYVYGTDGYFTQLRQINNNLQNWNDILSKQAVILAKAQAELSVADAGLSAATDEFESACDAFEKFTGGYSFDGDWQTDPKIGPLVVDDNNIHYLVTCGEQYQAKADFTQKKSEAESRYEALKTQYDEIAAQVKEAIEDKEDLHKAFYSAFYRFIQEGTWNSEEYYDDEKYYLDGLSTLYTSAVPKVSYSISVLELSQLQGYEDFTFAVGDRTYVEDPEFFGYDEDGAPIREEVVLSEITYNLDEPDKNSIKVQNFKTQFQDLFKKITATVQQVQFSTGAYDKAAQLADANDTQKSAYLQGALNDASTILQNLAEQTVRLDAEGLTITDGTEQNRSLRAVSGGILLTEDGGNTWDVGITAKGINAKILTAGTLNTGVVNIMYGTEPTFRWDAYGITAYDFDTITENNDIIYNLDPTSGVRFDRLGIYGFTGAPASGWHPDKVAEWTLSDVTKPPQASGGVRQHSLFELTEEGLYLDLGKGRSAYDYKRIEVSGGYNYASFSDAQAHETVASLGKVENVLYNKWHNSDPYYTTDPSDNPDNPFVKVMSVGYKIGNLSMENYALYDDGTVRAKRVMVSEGISYDDGSGLAKMAFSTSSVLPSDGTAWSTLPNNQQIAGDWHKVQGASDVYMATTYDNGAHWYGPEYVSGRALVNTREEYILTTAAAGEPADDDPRWSSTMPDTTGQYGKVLWIKIVGIREDGSEFKLAKQPVPIPDEVADFNLSSTAYAITVNKNGTRSPSGNIVVSAPEGWNSYAWTIVPYAPDGTQGTTVTSTGRTYVYNPSLATLIAYPRIHCTCVASTAGGASATDSLDVVAVFDGVDSWTVVNTNPTFTYKADHNALIKAVQTEATDIQVYHGSTLIPCYANDYTPASEDTSLYCKLLNLSNDEDITFSLSVANDHSKFTITGSTVVNQVGDSDGQELTVAIYSGTTLEVSLPTVLNWTFAYDGAPGSSGASALSVESNNDVVSVGANYDGTGATFSGEQVAFTVYVGNNIESNHWHIESTACYQSDGETPFVPSAGMISQSGLTLTLQGGWPNAVTSDSFIIKVRLEENSDPNQYSIKDIRVQRLRNGHPGVMYRLSCSIAALNRISSGYSPTTFNVASYQVIGNSSATYGHLAYCINNGNWDEYNGSSATVSVGSSGGDINLNLTSSASTISFAAIESGGVVNHALVSSLVLDGPELITIVKDGADGENGEGTYLNDIYYLTNDESELNAIISGTATQSYQTQYRDIIVKTTSSSYWNAQYSAPTSTKRFLIYCQQTVTVASNGTESLKTYTNPILLEAWLNNSALNATAAGRERYATLFRLTNGLSNQGIYYTEGSGVNDANLYINASMINTGALTVTDGSYTAFSASVDSHEVQIGGFFVDRNSLWYTGSSTSTAFTNSKFFISSTGSTSRFTVGNAVNQDGWIFFVRPGTTGNGVFGIRNDGSIYAQAGDIAGWTISQSQLSTGTLGQANGVGLIPGGTTVGSTSNVVFTAGANFKVTKTGTLYATDANITGVIDATGGTIGTSGTKWNIGSVPDPDDPDPTGPDPWPYIAAIYNGATSLAGAAGYGTNSNQVFIGLNGLSYGAPTSSTYVSDYHAVLKSSNFMIYGDSSLSGNHYTAIRLDCRGIYLHHAGSTKISSITSSTSLPATASITFHSSDFNGGQLVGNWYANDGTIITSDYNAKHDIESLDTRYLTFFDQLEPKRFKYNSGTSDRYHTGFIAQEAYNAMQAAGLTSQEIASICISGKDTTTESWGLRYEELIAILTAKIKSLEKRLEALES